MINVHQFDIQTMAESPQIRRNMVRHYATLPSKDCDDGANTVSRATTPLTANGATTTGLTVTVTPKDMQRNHLLKMPTATIEKPTITATSTSTTRKSSTAVRYPSPTLRILAKGLLLPILILGILVGSSQAGFACLSNPCVFGVCIDGLNSSMGKLQVKCEMRIAKTRSLKSLPACIFPGQRREREREEWKR